MIVRAPRRLGIVLAAALTLAAAPAAPALAAGTGTISGHLTDAGAPVAYAWVSVWPAVWDDGDNYTANTSTDETGFYQFPDVPAGQYKVSFSANDHPYQYAYGATDWDAAATITVTEGGTAVVDDSLLPTGTISGRFTDANGNGVQTSVSATSDSGGHGYGYADPDGYYTMRVLPGDYRVAFEVDQAGRQYAYGKTYQNEAQLFTVVAGATVTVNDTRLATGTLEGTFTDASGVGLPGVSVWAEGGEQAGSATTDDGGHFRLNVFPGRYRVHFDEWQLGISQYAYRATAWDAATVFEVAANTSTTVNDRALATGSVRVTATNALTGARIDEFWAGVGPREGSTTTGELLLDRVSEGTHEVSIGAEGYLGNRQRQRVTVVAGERAEVNIALTPAAKITTTVVDAATGQPLAGVCVFASQPPFFRVPDGCDSRSDADGKITVGYLAAGSYQLFAFPQEAPGFGAQWVGSRGGSGNQADAMTIEVGAGQTVTGPVIRMDQAGIVTGTVTTEDRSPVLYGGVRVGNEHFNIGGNMMSVPIGEDGSYRIDFLGPYRWPLLFGASGFAPQWSGNVGNRLEADTIDVKPGRSTTYDIRLKRGVLVNVSASTDDFIVAHNAVTGDHAGECWSESGTGCQMLVLGPQSVKFMVFDNGNWWFGGADFAHATSVWIPPLGTTSVTLTR